MAWGCQRTAQPSLNQLSSNRTQGVPNMIALVRDTAARIVAGQ